MGVFTQTAKRFTAIFLCFVLTVSALALSFPAHAVDYGIYDSNDISEWLGRYGVFGDGRGGNFGSSGKVGSFGGGRGGGFASNRSQNYYTTPTESVEDKYGNVTNYYRGGDTTSTKIIDSYNQTFNTIHNTSNTTNNYSANVKLSDFLNTYTTNNNNYTYNTRYNSWYYDNTQNTLNYDASQTYYQTDNRQYFVSIDNSTDEYYLIDVQYSPTFVTVNYTYNNIDNSTHYGDVTNIYYFELTDGRNSSTLTADEVSGLDLGYDVTNYVLVTDDPNTLSLQHFDGDYMDSSSYGRDFYSVNRSTNYVDSGDFGKALQLPSGSSAGVTIPGLSNYDSLAFDFRIYYSDISKLGIYLGDTNLLQRIPSYKFNSFYDYYTDDGLTYNLGRFCYNCAATITHPYPQYWDFPTGSIDPAAYGYTFSTALKSSHSVPTAASVSSWYTYNSSLYGWVSGSWSSPTVESTSESKSGSSPQSINSSYKAETIDYTTHRSYEYTTTISHRKVTNYKSFPVSSVAADFSYSTYINQWVSMRIVISGGNLYYFVNGDLVGSGAFTMPVADKFYISSTGTVYLDELRITTGDMVSTGAYTPSSAPYDTNKVLALPDDLTGNTIYVQHSAPVTNSRIGGVRPSNPTTGFFYIPLHDDYTGGQPQLYDGSNWVNVTAMVYDGSSVHDVIGYTFTPMGAAPDVDVDAKPERPTKPGEDVDPDTCTHEWEEESSIKPSCVMAGMVTLKCSKCGSTKTETIPNLNHVWVVKTSVQTSYDEEGNVVTQGYTIYKCTICGEEYKDTEGTGPPTASTPDDSDSEGGNWFTNLLKKIGEFLGTTIGGLLELLGTIIDKVLDSLITLVTNTIARLAELVDLFGSFGDALGVLWTWLPPEIVAVFVAGVTIFVFVALLKLFLK